MDFLCKTHKHRSLNKIIKLKHIMIMRYEILSIIYKQVEWNVINDNWFQTASNNFIHAFKKKKHKLFATEPVVWYKEQDFHSLADKRSKYVLYNQLISCFHQQKSKMGDECCVSWRWKEIQLHTNVHLIVKHISQTHEIHAHAHKHKHKHNECTID